MDKKHRIFHIINRNIDDNYKYSKEEIINSFKKEKYSLLNPREKIVLSKFFKECDEEDFISLTNTFDLSKEDIKRLYKDMPERKFSGVSDVWDVYFILDTPV